MFPLKTSAQEKGVVMKNDRDVEKMVSRMGLKQGPRKAVVQYGKGMLEGMHMAYRSVAKRMRSDGQDEAAIAHLLGPLVDEEELEKILEEAQN